MICKDVKKPSAKFHLKIFRNDITFYDQYKKTGLVLLIRLLRFNLQCTNLKTLTMIHLLNAKKYSIKWIQQTFISLRHL